MGSLVYRENMTFGTDVLDFNLEVANGWIPDCNNKLDYDPSIIRGSARVWRDGDYICSIDCGSDTIVSTGILSAGSVEAAKRKVEDWMQHKASVIRAGVIVALASD